MNGHTQELLEAVAALRGRVDALERQERPVPVVAQYSSTVGQSIPTATPTIVNFNTLVVDTHGAVATGAAWKFTAPLAGLYWIYAVVQFKSSAGWAETEYINLRVYKNGNGSRLLDYRFGQDSSAAARSKLAGGGAVIELAAGDEIDVRVDQREGGDLALLTSDNFTHVSIFKIN